MYIFIRGCLRKKLSRVILPTNTGIQKVNNEKFQWAENPVIFNINS